LVEQQLAVRLQAVHLLTEAGTRHWVAPDWRQEHREEWPWPTSGEKDTQQRAQADPAGEIRARQLAPVSAELEPVLPLGLEEDSGSRWDIAVAVVPAGMPGRSQSPRKSALLSPLREAGCMLGISVPEARLGVEDSGREELAHGRIVMDSRCSC
jgi:hypothetical protein